MEEITLGKLFRFYNQNRKKVWLIILVFIFAMLIIRSLNGIYKQERQDNIKQSNTEENITEKEENYENQSKSLVSGGSVSKAHQKEFGQLIDNFLTYCKNHEPEKAYGLLSQDCKSVLYPNEELFEQQYYKNKFSGEKKYSFQSWTSTDTYIYLVKIFNNMLATGKGSSQSYIQEYISIVKENDTYKLNVDGFIGKVQRNVEETKNGVSIKINNSEIYMDYEMVNLTIKNDTENVVVLDSRNDTGTMYLVDSNKNKSESMAYENNEEDFIIDSGEEKKITIKFSNPYNEKVVAKKYVFSDIRTNNGGDIEEIEVNVN